MVVTATLAVSWSMCLGIGHLTIYPANVHGERREREEALIWEARQEVGKAADCRRKADELGRRNAESLAYIITALSLTGLGIILGGLGLAVKAGYKPRNLVRPRLVDALADVGLTMGTVLLVGFAVGCIAYVGLMLFVLATSE